MSVESIDDYLEGVSSSSRELLQSLRETIHRLAPGALHFTEKKPLPEALVRKLLQARMAESESLAG